MLSSQPQHSGDFRSILTVKYRPENNHAGIGPAPDHSLQLGPLGRCGLHFHDSGVCHYGPGSLFPTPNVSGIPWQDATTTIHTRRKNPSFGPGSALVLITASAVVEEDGTETMVWTFLCVRIDFSDPDTAVGHATTTRMPCCWFYRTIHHHHHSTITLSTLGATMVRMLLYSSMAIDE